MSATRDPDRLFRAWLDLMPDEAPDRAIAAVLQATAAAPQVRAWPWLGRWRSPVNRFSLITAAVAIILALAGGVFLLASGRPGPTSAPATPSPAATPVSSGPAASAATAGPLPANLVGGWFGGDRHLTGLAPAAGTALLIDAAQLRLTQSNQQDTPLLRETVAMSGSRLQLVSMFAETYDGDVSCPKGTTGLYDVALSASARVLTVTRFSDPCSGRSAILSGTWWKRGCWNDGACYGDLDAGTYATEYFNPRIDPGKPWTSNYAGLTFTVPDGWALALDAPDYARLTPSVNYATEQAGDPPTTYQVAVVTQPFPKVGGGDCGSTAAPLLGSPRTVADIIAFLRGEAWINAGPTNSLTIDGHPATWLDLSLAAGSRPGCPQDPQPGGEYLTGFGVESWGFGLGGTMRTRLVLIDIGDGDVVAAVIEASDPTRFDALTAGAMPIIESFRFE